MIPILNKDLAVIQKLSDLPNSTDGLTAAELKAKFDEASLEIQRWLNKSLVPALTAANIPFEPSAQLNAKTVQDAVQLVFEQVRDASSGTIANGSVTKEKLAQALLERVFGGRVWVSLDKPTANDTPAEDFPVGQIWLRPGFTVKNDVAESWDVSGCTASKAENAVTFTGNNTVAQAEATMNLPNIGQDGDRVYVLFSAEEKDPEISSLTVSLNGSEEKSTALTAYMDTLSGSSLSVKFRAVWPSTSLAKGSFTIRNLAVVNVDSILRQVADCHDMADWTTFLKKKLPLDSYDSPRELYIQSKSGVWEQFDHEVFPVKRGGTGLDKVESGELLYGNGTDTMERLEVPDEDCLLQFSGGKPQWKHPDEVAKNAGYLRCTEVVYEGTGAERQIVIPGKAAVLFLRTDGTTYTFFQGTKMSGSYTIPGYSDARYTAGATLTEGTLDFWKELPSGIASPQAGAVHFNETGKQYKLTAIYE